MLALLQNIKFYPRPHFLSDSGPNIAVHGYKKKQVWEFNLGKKNKKGVIQMNEVIVLRMTHIMLY